ncbi:MAG: PAS domain S-box protein [Gemmatimonadales bacterium]
MSTPPTHVTRRRVRRYFLVAGAVTTLAGLTTVLVLLSARASGRWAEHTHAVLDRVVRAETAIENLRAQYRIFLLNGDSVSVAEVARGRAALTAAIDTLVNLTRDDPGQTARFAALKAVLARADTVRSVVDQARARGIEAGRATFNSGPHAEIRALVDSQIAAIEANERQLLSVREKRQRSAEVIASLVVMLSLAAGAVLVWWGWRRQQAEADALEAAEARYRNLTNQSPDGVIVHADGVVRYASPTAAALLAAGAPETLVGVPFSTLLHPDDRPAGQERLAALLSTGRPNEPRIFRLQRLDGQLGEVEARSGLVDFDGKPAVQVILRDVSDRLRMERELEHSEARFRSVINGMSEGMVMQDASGAITLWNPAAEWILGLDGDQLGGRRSIDPRWRAIDENGEVLPGDRHPAMVSLRSGKPCRAVLGIETGEGDRAWLRASSAPLFRVGETTPYAVLTTFADITSEWEAQQRVAESEERYRLLAENSNDLISLRSVDDRFLYASPSHQAVLGWKPEELVGTSAYELMHPDDRSWISKGPRAALAKGTRPGPVTLRVRHRDGHYVWVEGVATPLLNPAGELGGIQVTARDVTARRALEEELRQSQRLEAMGRMASGVAHDFNNLLTVIRASAELLHEGGGDEDFVQLSAAADRAELLTTQLLAFSRGQHSEPARVVLATLLRGAEDLLKRLAGPQVQVRL